jgi:hypothetical protein
MRLVHLSGTQLSVGKENVQIQFTKSLLATTVKDEGPCQNHTISHLELQIHISTTKI